MSNDVRANSRYLSWHENQTFSLVYVKKPSLHSGLWSLARRLLNKEEKELRHVISQFRETIKLNSKISEDVRMY
jgi:hypothetical protein